MKARVALALLFSALAACTSTATTDTETPPMVAPARTSEPTMIARTVARIEVPLAAGEGWGCKDKEYTHPLDAFVAQCWREGDDELVLTAKVYVVPADQVLPGKQLVEEVYPKNYGKMFSAFEIKETKAVKVGKHDAFDILVDAIAERGPTRVHERVVVMGTSVFLLTAIGSPKAFDTFAAARKRWFDETRFRDLKK